MLGRPKPGDSEEDLLRYQDRFLASGGEPGVQVVRRPDKRRGEPGTRTPAGETELGATRDIVSMDEFPEQPPPLTPAPPQKKSRFRSDRVRFEKDDPAERLDREDPHLTAVLSRIINIAARTANAVSEPSQNDAPAGITGQKLAPPLSEKMQAHQTDSNPSFGAPLGGGAPRLVSGQGLGGPGGLTAARQIHLENEAWLRGMSKAEILQEQGRLLAQLARSQEDGGTEGQMDTQTEPTLSDTEEGPIDMDSDTEGRDKESEPPITVEDLPVKPQEGWVHMNQLEPEKLEWIKDLPKPRKRGTRQAMQARFDFSGSLIPPEADLPPHLGLHHHGEEPQLAGYSLQELFHLSRSQVTRQRSLALTTLARILHKARSGHFASSLRGSVLSTLLDAGLLFLLRFSLDDSVGGVMAAAVHALWALLVAPDDEMQVLARLRYILEVVRPGPRVVQDVLEVLTRIARHSSASASQLNSLGLRERLSRYLALEPQDLLLEPREAVRLSTEALRLWSIAAGYGQACDLYSNPESDSPPPPPVEWSHVTGLRPFLVGSLKSCVGGLSDPLLREGAQRLSTAILLYLGSFYTQLPAQSSFQPVHSLQEMESLSSEVLEPLLSHQAVRSMMSELSCCGGKPALSLAGSQSPFPFLTGLCYLLHAMASTHRGLAGKFSPLLLSEAVIGYLRSCCEATPPLSLSSGWLLRHEYHLQYLLLKLAARLIPVHAAVSQHASLYHQVAMAMLPRLLPGSEHLAHDLLSTLTFNPDFIPEGRCGGPEAADLNQLLHLKESHSDPSPLPASQPDPSPSSSLGALLREAYSHLPSLRSCYLTHLSQLEPLVLRSRESYLGCTPFVQSQLLPPLSGPALPSDWPFLPLVTLYERAGQAESRGCAVETLPPASVESAVRCLQWLLVLELWREGGGKAVSPAAKLCRLACLFLCGSDLFLEPPVQRYGWAVLRSLCSPPQLAALDLGFPGSPPPGLASFQDLYSALLAQFEAVSFGDPLFGCFLLIPLQRRFSAELRLAVFGEHVGLLRSLGVTLAQLPVPLQLFTSPPEDSLSLLQLYFRALVMGALRRAWCPVLYAVAISHLNTFLFSQEPAPQVPPRYPRVTPQNTQDTGAVAIPPVLAVPMSEINTALHKVDTARRGLLRKTYFLTDEVLRTHLLLFKLPRGDSELGFEMYEQLPPIRDKRLSTVLGRDGGAV
ncbi:RNA polymerase II-associated protein 1 [Acipenser ruthenus]|uniref:RNA polymerase II-associated protein 1 n=1 Tax=Acipenser ruthenus TaxID=7906 RepID=A0A444UFY1_ACIRT|nr:RNA polymerase II-associated protein 1 [Acipenser ruthenus]